MWSSSLLSNGHEKQWPERPDLCWFFFFCREKNENIKNKRTRGTKEVFLYIWSLVVLENKQTKVAGYGMIRFPLRPVMSS